MIRESHRYVIAAFFLILVFSAFFSCKTAEKIPGEKLRPITPVRLYRNAAENMFDYKQFAIKRINIQFDNGKSKTSFRAGIQAWKDESVILSISKLNILIAKIMMTPDSVVFVNYFDKSYFTGDYQPISDLLSFDLDFNTLQAIISANIFTLFEDEKEIRDFQTGTGEGMYTLQSEKVRKISRLEEKGRTQRAERILRRVEEDLHVVETYYFDPHLFLTRKMVMEDKESLRYAEIRFADYERVGEKYFPTSVELDFRSESDLVLVSSKMGGFSTEPSEFVPLKIPVNYQRVFLN